MFERNFKLSFLLQKALAVFEGDLKTLLLKNDFNSYENLKREKRYR